MSRGDYLNIGNKLKFRRKELNLTMLELAKKVGVSEATVSRWESGDIANMRRDKIVSLAKALDVTPGYIMGWENEEINFGTIPGITPIELKKFRMLGDIACGTPIVANEEYSVYVEANADIDADFCLRAKGDSMIDANIHDGDIVFIKEQDDIPNGKIAAVLIEDEVTLKRIYIQGDTLTLLTAFNNISEKYFLKFTKENVMF